MTPGRVAERATVAEEKEEEKQKAETGLSAVVAMAETSAKLSAVEGPLWWRAVGAGGRRYRCRATGPWGPLTTRPGLHGFRGSRAEGALKLSPVITK